MNENTFAFPWTHDDITYKGMTLRDYFAAKAMQSLIIVYTDDKNIVAEYAQRAYEIADAMLKARETNA
jgi:hypothetical protein